jgi:hypothetical protein
MMRRVLLLFFSALLVGVFTPFSTFAQTPTVAEAIATLEAAATALEAGNPEKAEQLLGSLRAVTLENGTTINLADQAWETLVEQPSEVAAATLRDLAQRLREPQSTLPDDSRQRLEEVLARPEFQDAQPTLLERFLRWLSELLPDASPDMRGLVDAAVGVFGVLVIGALIFFVVRIVRHNWREGETLESFGEIPIHATEAQAKATSAAGAGDFREAMRLLYLAALLHLDEVGLLRFDRALTNREVLATVVNRTPLHAALSPVVTQFDRVWYGHAPFGAADFERMQGQIEQLREMNPKKGATRQ